MGKRLFLLLIVGFMGIINTPEILMATDSVVAENPVFNAVETVPLPEPEPEPAPEPKSVSLTVQYAAPVAGYATMPATPQITNYTVTVYSGTIVADNLSYYDIYKTNKLVYGHNSYNLLGNLSNRYVGETITITEGGVTQTYRVSDVVLYEKTSEGYLNHDRTLMGKIMRTALGHSVALMTCAGTSYGNGDASHRLVVYADAM